ncbi:MAG: hypothetical protein C0392_16125 [Syntrophus sp. (in: bacteria)]|nr:hypothetical protein [Syntrophus sp. (in: bacteria)]
MHQGSLAHAIAVLIIVFGLIVETTYAEQSISTSEMSTTEIARHLANPNSPLASLTMKNQYTLYKGSLPRADNQGNYAMTFQPAFPFRLDNGDRLFFRPTIPLLINNPVFDAGKGGFDGQSGLGDISLDLAYGQTLKSGFLWATGMSTTLPTATGSGLGGQQWTLGPRAGLGLIKKWGVLAVFSTNQWDVAGWANASTSVLTIQPFVTLLLGEGWAVGTNPSLVYNWNQSQWTLPLELVVSKTVRIGKTPVRLGFTFDYYIKQPDNFGPKLMIGFNITPVVKNIIAEVLQ